MKCKICTFAKLAGIALGLALSLPVSARYVQVNLVSDGSVPGTVKDVNLVNPWGIASSPSGPFWVSDNGTGVSTLYNGTTGLPLPLVVTIPPPAGSPVGTKSTPTGQVFNSTSGFTITDANGTGRSTFMFATEDGTIAAWKGGAPLQTSALRMVDNSAAGAVYKGLAIGSNASGNFLYAANFSAGKIDVFNGLFGSATLPGSFVDPSLPSGYSPFNIQNLGGKIYVAYAKQSPTNPRDELAGPGLGFVDVFDTDGVLLRRIATGATLNAPWGLALAPAGFGEFSHALLVGNFGDGRINAFDASTDAFLGQLTDPVGKPITIDGLWGLQFGNNGAAGLRNELFFAAGINDEANGLFGKLVAVPEPGTFAIFTLGLVVLGLRRKLAGRSTAAPDLHGQLASN